MYTDTARIYKLEQITKSYSDKITNLNNQFESYKQQTSAYFIFISAILLGVSIGILILTPLY